MIAFGGGSGLDLGKMVAFFAGQTRPIWDFEDIGDWWTRADADAIAPIIAVPTTAGTGSEVGRASIITNSVTHEKKIIFHPKVLPSVVIADPELTVGMPKFITAGTGLDAFAHCVEAFSSPHYHPMSQGIALEGMRLVIDYLPRAYVDGTDLEARANMMSAAAMGATAFQKGLGAIHALSHPVGAIFNTHMARRMRFVCLRCWNSMQVRLLTALIAPRGIWVSMAGSKGSKPLCRRSTTVLIFRASSRKWVWPPIRWMHLWMVPSKIQVAAVIPSN